VDIAKFSRPKQAEALARYLRLATGLSDAENPPLR
jgi:hypothetical protein